MKNCIILTCLISNFAFAQVAVNWTTATGMVLEESTATNVIPLPTNSLFALYYSTSNNVEVIGVNGNILPVNAGTTLIATGSSVELASFNQNFSDPESNFYFFNLLTPGGYFTSVAFNLQNVVDPMTVTFNPSTTQVYQTAPVFAPSAFDNFNPATRYDVYTDAGGTFVETQFGGVLNGAAQLAAIPEPGTIGLLVFGGLTAMVAYRRRRSAR